jgi:uncharacterized protein (UPF0276 family)
VFLETRPQIAWVEVHSENYFAAGGAALDCLESTRAAYPVSLHGVGLSLGSTDVLDLRHLRSLRRLVERIEPAIVSEHLSWGSVDGQHFNDLLPLPYTQESLRHMVSRVAAVQDYLGREILVENASTYLQLACSDISEADFLVELAERAGCGILLDVNNVYVSARNHGFDAEAYLEKIPSRLVREIHLAGHSVDRCGGAEILIDTHSRPVADAVWRLFRFALARYGAKPTLIEWDAELPPLEVLVGEAAAADRLLGETRELAA